MRTILEEQLITIAYNNLSPIHKLLLHLPTRNYYLAYKADTKQIDLVYFNPTTEIITNYITDKPVNIKYYHQYYDYKDCLKIKKTVEAA